MTAEQIEERRERMREIGRLGGRATATKYGADHMAAIGRKGFNTLAERVGSPYAACRYIQRRGAWGVLAGVKIGGDCYADYHARPTALGRGN